MSKTNREQTILAEALRLPPEERAAYVAEATIGNPALREEVESLLRNHGAGEFLEQAAVSELRATVRTAPATERPGDRIDRYKLLQQIGEGGCGVVYMAEQVEPVRRRVALKIIKLGMDTRSVIARFEAERQALALMDHPNIAKVLDAGATEAGRPYFVMELVRGTKITDFCDKRKLSTRQRLDLFIQVCQAIQHAHQKGIIHRDIKPSNILVSEDDGSVVPKVIDFGVAKATSGQRLTDKTLFTAFEQFIGTPAYMSPEQALVTNADIDTRSDIYALGVLLYELMTGQTPFDAKELLSIGLDEMRRTIREKEPDRPSMRVSTLPHEALSTTAHQRSLEPPKLVSELKGDLDWIVMKCLEKNRARRYETANGLAADIQRHMDDEPVVACPPSRWYELQKTVRRHKVGFATTAAVIVALACGLALAGWMYTRERAAVREQVRLRQEADLSRTNEVRMRLQAEANEKKALTEAAKSQQIAQFHQDMLASVGPSVAMGRDTTILREILDRTAERLDKELTNQPEVEAELRTRLGRTYIELCEYPKAEEMLRAAVELRRKVLGNESAPLAESLQALALTLNNREAESLQREALSIRRKLFSEESTEVAGALNGLALQLLYRGKLSESEQLYREAGATRRKLLGNENEALAWSLVGLGLCLGEQGRQAEAEDLFRETVAIRRTLHGRKHPALAHALNILGCSLLVQGKLTEAESTLREALTMQEELLPENDPNTVDTRGSLATAYLKAGKFDQALPLVEATLEGWKALGEPVGKYMVVMISNLASALNEAGKFDQSLFLLEEMLKRLKVTLGTDHQPTEDTMKALANALALQVAMLLEAEEFGKAELVARECLRLRDKLIPNDWLTFNAQSVLGGSLLGQKKYVEAEPLLLSGYEGMIARRDKIPSQGLPRIEETLQRLIQLYEDTDRSELAGEWMQKRAEFEGMPLEDSSEAKAEPK